VHSYLLALQIIFWVCLGAVGYSYALYPVLLTLLARRGKASKYEMSAEVPLVSVLIAAHNEEQFIHEKVRNTLASSHPHDRMEIVVASDGSTDGTAAIVRDVNSPRIRLFDYSERRGKSTVLNATFPELTGEIVVLSDANTLFAPDAISKLVRWFADPAVDAVCGRLILTDPATGQNVDSLYWRYETYL
jgi:cellulose synthase/poly-beta-1,6-N-acetylglucosamine synthase-like glycosyltransferase